MPEDKKGTTKKATKTTKIEVTATKKATKITNKGTTATKQATTVTKKAVTATKKVAKITKEVIKDFNSKEINTPEAPTLNEAVLEADSANNDIKVKIEDFDWEKAARHDMYSNEERATLRKSMKIHLLKLLTNKFLMELSCQSVIGKLLLILILNQMV
jgi:hypothetical protein